MKKLLHNKKIQTLAAVLLFFGLALYHLGCCPCHGRPPMSETAAFLKQYHASDSPATSEHHFRVLLESIYGWQGVQSFPLPANRYVQFTGPINTTKDNAGLEYVFTMAQIHGLKDTLHLGFGNETYSYSSSKDWSKKLEGNVLLYSVTPVRIRIQQYLDACQIADVGSSSMTHHDTLILKLNVDPSQPVLHRLDTLSAIIPQFVRHQLMEAMPLHYKMLVLHLFTPDFGCYLTVQSLEGDKYGTALMIPPSRICKEHGKLSLLWQ